MMKLGNRKNSRKFTKGVCACAMACAVAFSGVPTGAVMSVVQAEENVGSWVYDEEESLYFFTDENGWKYSAWDMDDEYCSLVSIPETTTGDITIPKSITVDGEKWIVYQDEDLIIPKGATVKTPWKYDEQDGVYYYTDANGWKYSIDELDDTECYLEEVPSTMEGELTIPSVAVIEGEELPLSISYMFRVPSGVTSLIMPRGGSLSSDAFEDANSNLVVHGYAGDDVCLIAIDKGLQVEYYDVFTDDQGVNYRIIFDDEGEESTQVSVYTYTGKGGKVTVPETVSSGDKTYTVIEVDSGAFYKATKVTGVTLPTTITSIGSNVFQGCTALTSFKMPNKVNFMGESTFYGCSKLKSVSLSTKLSTVTSSTFYKCTSLTSVTVPNNISYISPNAFYGCSKLTKITLGTKLTGISTSAFAKCTKLKTVTIKSKVLDEIGESAFSGDKALKTITLKATKLTKSSIGKNAFKGTKKKMVIKVPSSKVKAYKKFMSKYGNKTVVVKKG